MMNLKQKVQYHQQLVDDSQHKVLIQQQQSTDHSQGKVIISSNMRFMLGDFTQKDLNSSKDNIHKHINYTGGTYHHQHQVDHNNFGNAISSPIENRQFFTQTNASQIVRKPQKTAKGKRKIKSQMRKTVRLVDDFSPNMQPEPSPVIKQVDENPFVKTQEFATKSALQHKSQNVAAVVVIPNQQHYFLKSSSRPRHTQNQHTLTHSSSKISSTVLQQNDPASLGSTLETKPLVQSASKANLISVPLMAKMIVSQQPVIQATSTGSQSVSKRTSLNYSKIPSSFSSQLPYENHTREAIVLPTTAPSPPKPTILLADRLVQMMAMRKRESHNHNQTPGKKDIMKNQGILVTRTPNPYQREYHELMTPRNIQQQQQLQNMSSQEITVKDMKETPKGAAENTRYRRRRAIGMVDETQEVDGGSHSQHVQQQKYNYLYQVFKEQLQIKKKRMEQINKKALLSQLQSRPNIQTNNSNDHFQLLHINTGGSSSHQNTTRHNHTAGGGSVFQFDNNAVMMNRQRYSFLQQHPREHKSNLMLNSFGQPDQTQYTAGYSSLKKQKRQFLPTGKPLFNSDYGVTSQSLAFGKTSQQQQLNGNNNPQTLLQDEEEAIMLTGDKTKEWRQVKPREFVFNKKEQNQQQPQVSLTSGSGAPQLINASSQSKTRPSVQVGLRNMITNVTKSKGELPPSSIVVV